MATKQEMIEQCIELDKKVAKYNRQLFNDYTCQELRAEVSDLKKVLELRKKDYEN